MALGTQDRSVQMKLNMPKNIVLLQTMEEILWTVASVMSSKSILLLWVSKSEPLGHFTGDLFIIFTSVPAQTWSNFSFPFRVIYLILIFTTLFQALLFFLFRLWLRIKNEIDDFHSSLCYPHTAGAKPRWWTGVDRKRGECWVHATRACHANVLFFIDCLKFIIMSLSTSFKEHVF